MTAQEAETEHEAKIIRAVIIARGREGATLHDIKQDYYEQVGKSLVNDNEYAQRKWLENIAHVKTEYRNGSVLYFSEAPEQEHLAKLIRKQRNSSRGYRKVNPGLHDTLVDENVETFKTPKAVTASARRRLANSSFRADGTLKNKLFKQPKTPSRTFTYPSKPHAVNKVLPVTSSIVGSAHKDFSHFSDDENNNSIACSNFNTSFSTNCSVITDKIIEQNQRDPYKPEFYTCTVVGDNFFLSLVVQSMGYRMVYQDKKLQSGYCVSGQTIDEAAQHIQHMPSNQLILLNVGSVDIMKGRELIELVISMMRLLSTCKMNQITPVLTTLLPIANHRVPMSRIVLMNDFNQFLLKNPFDYPVIDLHKAFINNEGKMDANCYQQAPRFVSGFKKPVVLWSRMGCQRIMTALKQEIGSAILKVLLK